jgi:hypothetical protein
MAANICKHGFLADGAVPTAPKNTTTAGSNSTPPAPAGKNTTTAGSNSTAGDMPYDSPDADVPVNATIVDDTLSTNATTTTTTTVAGKTPATDSASSLSGTNSTNKSTNTTSSTSSTDTRQRSGAGLLAGPGATVAMLASGALAIMAWA